MLASAAPASASASLISTGVRLHVSGCCGGLASCHRPWLQSPSPRRRWWRRPSHPRLWDTLRCLSSTAAVRLGGSWGVGGKRPSVGVGWDCRRWGCRRAASGRCRGQWRCPPGAAVLPPVASASTQLVATTVHGSVCGSLSLHIGTDDGNLCLHVGGGSANASASTLAMAVASSASTPGGCRRGASRCCFRLDSVDGGDLYVHVVDSSGGLRLDIGWRRRRPPFPCLAAASSSAFK